MLPSDLTIKPFESEKATNADFVAINAFDNQIKAEGWPDDPPATLEETIRDWQKLPSYIDQRTWFVSREDSGEIVAQAGLSLRRTAENRHAAWSWIGVIPEMRRLGIARELLRHVVEAARTDDRRLLIGTTNSVVPAGDAFMERLGANKAMAAYTNQLDMADLNHDLVRDWLNRAAALESEFEFGLWDGPFPEADLEAIAELQTVMNTAPRDNLELEDSPPNVEQLRELETWLAQRGLERWMMYVRDRASNRLAGYTEVLWDREQPQLLQQGDTGVFPEYRNRGLGTWLKAAMLEKVLRERPEVKFVRTGNAQSNAPMLSINQQLGFKPYRSTYNWQVPIDRVAAYLSG